MFVVAVGTMALVIVLSVFNGLEDLIRSLYSAFDPELKVVPKMGKSFETDEAFLDSLEQIEGVGLITEVIEDNALIQYKEAQMVVKLKGVSENFLGQGRLASTLVYGEPKLKDGDSNYAIIGRGIQYSLSIAPDNDYYALQVFYPKNVRPSQLDVSQSISRKLIKTSAVFAIEKQYDENYVFVPLNFAEELMDYAGRRTSLEIKVADGYTIRQAKRNLRAELGNKFTILDSDEQHSSLLKAIKIEKLFVFITFSFILAVASINIFFSLSMLAIDKKKDIAILASMGADKKIVKNIFLIEGAIIAFSGAGIGLFLGFLICTLQQEFGLVSMGMQTSVLDAYPVKMEFWDFVYTAVSIIIITFLASYRPAALAGRTKMRDLL